jgi:hypothetical protein
MKICRREGLARPRRETDEVEQAVSDGETQEEGGGSAASERRR